MAEQTLNVPQLIVFIIVTVLAVRWYLSKPSATGTRPQSDQVRNVRISPAQIDQIATMFPQLQRRDIAWDLQRNGGNVAATTERMLNGGRLDAAPISFNPPIPRSATASRAATPSARTSHPDLITRYNLQSRVSTQTAPAASESQSNPKAWSQDRSERQANLQRRREEMILAARRKMEEKEREKTKA
ncbi:hypothetical protein EJ04DRAFT_517069 [Polyplosphaeria fusca]|uniref:Coupling of ubiquitin conjugation to ER degradation protein 1 n=1 Tax=Polyplosphaeria fusca TaxID=682080 RepID=A0A9P4QLM7_9PLEO|nr:hypothetical protein EJ04DRAFT_517069 [Polyplosphaeria fusca]